LEGTSNIRFYHQGGKIEKPLIESDGLNEGSLFHSGSRIVAGLYQTDPRFNEFIGPIKALLPKGLESAAALSRKYIRACESELGRKLDPRCSTIGGSIFMAIITKANGFQWVEELEAE
jgi:hypothetical protein